MCKAFNSDLIPWTLHGEVIPIHYRDKLFRPQHGRRALLARLVHAQQLLDGHSCFDEEPADLGEEQAAIAHAF
jgi:hypothetical protein